MKNVSCAIFAIVGLWGAPALAQETKEADAQLTGAPPADSDSVPRFLGPQANRGARIDRLTRKGQYDKAADELVKLLALRRKDPSSVEIVSLELEMRGDINSLSTIEKLANEEASNVKLRAEQDRLTALLKADSAKHEDLADWVQVCLWLRDNDALLGWFDRVKNDEPGRKAARKFSDELEPLLVRRGNWKDLTVLYNRPIQRVIELHHAGDREARFFADQDKETRDLMADFDRERFREKVTQLYIAYLAAGDDAIAARIAEKATDLDLTSEIAQELVRGAIYHGQARAAQAELIDLAEKRGAEPKELRQELDKALSEKK